MKPLKFPLPSWTRLPWRTRPFLGGCALVLLLGLSAWWWWNERPVSPDVAARIGQLARDTGSPTVWRMYEDAARHGLTAGDVRRIVDAAKAAEPPYGLIRGDGHDTDTGGP